MSNFIWLYIFIASCWFLYILNSFYQNRKMKQYIPTNPLHLLVTPFYIFAAITFYRIEEALIRIVLQDHHPSLLLWQLPLVVIGGVAIAGAIFLYAYVNFFESNFPSCIAVQNGKDLTGIYKYIRHPSYYIFLLITFGSALVLLSPLLFAIAGLNHISLYFYYLIEEKQLSKKNPAYAEYLKKSKRFFPTFK